jgi:hypothetical protein
LFPALCPAHAQSACDLLSRSDIQQVIGTAGEGGRSQVNTGVVSTCVFDFGGDGRIAVLVRHHARRDWILAQSGRMASQFRSVEGLGDRAYRLHLQAGAALCIYRGEDYLQVSALRTKGADRLAEELARRILSRLGNRPEGAGY